jgi:hypothetical protein
MLKHQPHITTRKNKMNSPLGLKEVLALIDDPRNLNDPRLAEFIDSVDSMAVEILKDKDNNYLTGVIGFLSACVMADSCIDEHGELDILNLLEMVEWVKDSNNTRMIALIFKMTVGLAALEELH